MLQGRGGNTFFYFQFCILTMWIIHSSFSCIFLSWLYLMQLSHEICVFWWGETFAVGNGSSVFKLWPLSLIKIFLDKVLPTMIMICNIQSWALTPSTINFIITMFLKCMLLRVSCFQKQSTCCLFAKENVRFTAEMDVEVQAHFFPVLFVYYLV